METKLTKGVLKKLETAKREIAKLWNNGNVFAYSMTSVNSQGELKTVYAASYDPVYLFSNSHFPECLNGCFLNWKWCSFISDTCLKKRFQVGFGSLHYCTHVSNSLSVMKTQKDDEHFFSTKRSRVIYMLQFKIGEKGNKEIKIPEVWGMWVHLPQNNHCQAVMPWSLQHLLFPLSRSSSHCRT